MIIFLTSLFFLTSNSFGCDFNQSTKSVYSLSGPVTLAIQELGLIKKSALKGVSTFHPISKKEFSGELLPGGVFLSHDKIKGFKDSVIFYDESRELTRMFARYPQIKSIEVKSRSLTPAEVVKNIENVLTPYVTSCDLNQLSQSLKQKQETLKSLITQNLTLLFFLGSIQGEKYPDLLMVNDGVVKWLSEEKLIKSYPSKLAYVNWSAKIMQTIPSSAIKIGLKDSGSSLDIKMSRIGNAVNLTYPGSLIPGSGQVEAVIYLFKNL